MVGKENVQRLNLRLFCLTYFVILILSVRTRYIGVIFYKGYGILTMDGKSL